MTAESRSRDQKPFVVIAVAHATKREGFRGVFLHFSLDIKQRSVRYSRAMKLSSARARKLAGMRKTHGAGSGRPRGWARGRCGAMAGAGARRGGLLWGGEANGRSGSVPRGAP